MNTQGKSALAVSVATAIGGLADKADATTYLATLTGVATYSNNGTAGTPGNITSATSTWVYDDVTNLMTQTGGLYNMRVTTAPTTTLYRHSITGLIMGNGGVASAITYVCTEGNFGGGVGSSICGNYNFGGNFNESTTSWGPGTATSRTMGGDDVAIGAQQSIAGLNSMALISWTGTTLILSNGTCTGICTTTAGGFNAGSRWTFNAGPQSAGDSEPDPFSFTTATDVALATASTSGAVTVAGIAIASPISVVNGAYSIGCTGTYVTTDGTINNGETVCVQHTSAATPATDTVTTLTIGGIAGTYTSTTVAADAVPDAFSFAPQIDVGLDVPIESAPAVIGGINTATPISVSAGAEYRIDAGPYVTANGSVTNGQTVTVRQTSSTAALTATTATLTIGGVAADFTVTTAAVQPDTTPNQFTFEDQENVEKGAVIVSEPVEITGINSPAPITVTGGEYSIDGGAFTTAEGTVTEGQMVTVRHTSATTSGTVVSTTLSVGPAGAGTRISDVFSSGTPRSGGSSSVDGLILSVLGLLGLARRRKNQG